MFTMQAIIADKYQDDAISTVKVLVLQINNNHKSRLTEIINFLNEKFSMNKLSLGHLKRIDSKRKACRIVICPIPETSKNGDQDDGIISQTLDQLDEDMQKFLNDFGLENLKIFPVPASAPLTRNQFQRTSMLWPVNFHENKRIAGCLSGSVFSKDHLERINKLMNETLSLDVASSHHNGGNKKKCSTIITKNDGKHIVTKAVSRMHHEHPLHHAIILAISNVADIHSKYKSSNVVDLEPELVDQYKDDYLCTNYECFISQEPCMMCAMALVHSRIKRVFFFYSTNDDGDEDCLDQSYTVHNLHINPDLNHRYEAWRLTLNSDHSVFPNKKLKS